MSGRRPDTRERREKTSDSATPAPSSPELTGVVGDASATGSRSGEDTRRRGWFWHWNTTVTQYAPLIGLKGVGLLNSYTVWTDRREESPHRGYAFPSQQSEADFYGEDRAELITINKILVALDLIEIRKEMVPRTDERGRRWKVPHNFYRVKDHGDGFTLTTGDVMRVIELADRDRAVYRYLRRLFSPRFAPIDPQNVWHAILEEIRPSEPWQRLAARTERDETRASARSRAGHASRRVGAGSPVFSAPDGGDTAASEATGFDSNNDSTPVETGKAGMVVETSVATTNTGSATTDDMDNTGRDDSGIPSVAPINRGGETSVRPSNRTYHQVNTTTTTGDPADSVDMFGPATAPDAARAETVAVRTFEEANDRPSSPAERRMLGNLAGQFAQRAASDGMTGWHWVRLAIDDAVAAGSAFVAPRRIREILSRWEREGLPAEYGDNSSARADAPTQEARASVTRTAAASHRPYRGGLSRDWAGAPAVPDGGVAEPVPPPPFVVAECGMTSRQVWSAVLAELQMDSVSGRGIGRADVDTWLRDTVIAGRGGPQGQGGALVLGVPHEIGRRRASGRYLGQLRRALARVIGADLGVEIVLLRDWSVGADDSDPDDATPASSA